MTDTEKLAEPSPKAGGELAPIIRWIEQVIERADSHGNTEGLWLLGYQWRRVLAALRTPEQPDRNAVLVEEARDILSGLSSYLGAGLGDDGTTLAQYDDRIRWGIDHIGSVYRSRAAQVVEECSKRPHTTWGNVKRAILDDTCLPTASGKDAALRASPDQEVERTFKIGDRVRKTKGSSWTGRVVGTYSTALTPEGYAVESENEPGSVQIYPVAALTTQEDHRK